ncbi:HNH endonuclease [Streptococcus constellatus]|uniref:HNH endonuclease n=1 Tax=Streptococcus anginosus TaxID=1328 RepID=A0A2T0G5K5_STRAP|nr:MULTISPECIES: HNH endonuclease signature motif containing protein [Streptococcus anginosus group]HEO3401827.1 HNH endonuclease [Streptococcus agalactiae]MCW1033877.1 HNH endonuclease [Streptococcus anginosus]MCW1060529.1 HNH endonuclease [Streptococcus anginosus]MED5794116.1 HNH endonuclease signature motif containing protein [Streptococcus anginosus]MED5795963.1 HNH endonuclease signature motif containing protein [Streptococcus anginosus]
MTIKRKHISKTMRLQVLQKYNHHCAYCGCEISFKSMRVDHFLPLQKGGLDEVGNYMPACHQCNHYKSVFTIEQFRNNLKSVHERLLLPFLPRLCEKYGIIAIKPFDGKFYFEKLEEKTK